MRAAAGSRCQALLLRHWTTGRVLLASEAVHTAIAESSSSDGAMKSSCRRCAVDGVLPRRRLRGELTSTKQESADILQGSGVRTITGLPRRNDRLLEFFGAGAAHRVWVASRIVVYLLERDDDVGALRPQERQHDAQALGWRPVVAGTVVDREQAAVSEEHLARRNHRGVARQVVVEDIRIVDADVDGSRSKRHKHMRG
eukprot:scaffold779_cov48-Phaeocystis_antarctica.AAC.2